MIIQPRIISAKIPWFRVVDDADNIIALPNVDEPSKLDSWECKIEINIEDFKVFDFNTRPDDFTVNINGEDCIVSYTPSLPQELITWNFNDGVTNRRLISFFPDPVDAENRAYIRLQLITAITFPEYLPLENTLIEVKIKDFKYDDAETINFSVDINDDFDFVTVENYGTSVLQPKILNGDSFEVLTYG